MNNEKGKVIKINLIIKYLQQTLKFRQKIIPGGLGYNRSSAP